MAFHETIASDESVLFEQYAAELRELQRKRASGPTKERALHLKPHLGAVGELVVAAPEPLRVGVFASAGRRFPVYARFSNGSSARQPDKVPDVRGLALKLVGVEGKKIISGLESALTQDFLFITTPELPFRDPREFMAFVRAAKDGPAKLLPRVFKGFGLLRGFALLAKLLSSPKVTSLATVPFFTAAPISFGDGAAKLGLFPEHASELPARSGDAALRDDIVQRLKQGALNWSLRAQAFVDDTSTPIEDASASWGSPWVEIGKLTLPLQDADSSKGREIAALVETLSFDPWHAIEAHRPLGAIMRARAVAYRESVIGREAAKEPESVILP